MTVYEQKIVRLIAKWNKAYESQKTELRAKLQQEAKELEKDAIAHGITAIEFRDMTRKYRSLSHTWYPVNMSRKEKRAYISRVIENYITEYPEFQIRDEVRLILSMYKGD